MSIETMPITPAVISWAREYAGFSLASTEARFPGITAWESGKASPTYPQLERLADKFQVPVAVFFFPDPPEMPSVRKAFPTLGAKYTDKAPPHIRLMMRRSQAFLMALNELYQGKSHAPQLITQNLAFSITDDRKEIAVAIRSSLAVSLDTQCAWKNADTALTQWRQRFADVGVHVFKDQFKDSNFFGFCLHDSEFPIIYINNEIPTTGQMFTMFCELTRLLFSVSNAEAIDNIEKSAPTTRQIENVCKEIASLVLIPDDAFDQAFSGHKVNTETAISIARKFNISPKLICQKFVERGLIDLPSCESAEWLQDAVVPKNDNYYDTKIADLGEHYICHAFREFYQNRINARQLADYLNIAPRHLDEFEAHALQESPALNH